jgi:hypothetical protein
MALSFDPISFNTPRSNATAYGNAVDLANIWKTNRASSFSPSDFIAQDIANKSALKTAASKADAYAMGDSLDAIGLVSTAEKVGEQIKKNASRDASKSKLGSGLGALFGMTGTIASGGNPLVGAFASKLGQGIGNAAG